MLVGVSGSVCSGKNEVVRYLTYQGFHCLTLSPSSKASSSNDSEAEENFHPLGSAEKLSDKKFDTFEELFEYVTVNWQQQMVISPLEDEEHIAKLAVRPYFLHIICDAPLKTRFRRYCEKHSADLSFEEFVDLSEKAPNLFARSSNNYTPTIKIINATETTKDLYIQLSKLDVVSNLRLRPDWDTYFMRLANLAALRSNCMKRRVGCVIVRDNRVVATGYNGTPRHLTNCNEGGCPRCNTGTLGLSTCLCLHAEENALLESGRERISKGDSILYCNTCPCLTCSIKIIQSGISQVVYSQSYSMDSSSRKILNEAGVVLRQFSPPEDIVSGQL